MVSFNHWLNVVVTRRKATVTETLWKMLRIQWLLLLKQGRCLVFAVTIVTTAWTLGNSVIELFEEDSTIALVLKALVRKLNLQTYFTMGFGTHRTPLS